jgi:hypothetical protein
MDKAYDVKDLLARCKKDGLDLVEAEVGLFYKHLKEWAKDSAPLSQGKVDDMLSPFYGQLDPIFLPLIDKIDGEVG